MAKSSKRADMLALVRTDAFKAGSATAQSAASIRAAAAPMQFVKADDGRMVPSPAMQKRIDELRPQWLHGFVASQLLADSVAASERKGGKPAMSEAAAFDAALAVIEGIPHNSKQTAGSNVRRRTKREDTIMQNSRQYWRRAERLAGIASTHPNAGNSNAAGKTASGQGKGKAETAKPKAEKPKAMDVAQLWEYIAHTADTLEKTVNKANAKTATNEQSRLVNEFFIAVRAAMPANK